VGWTATLAPAARKSLKAIRDTPLRGRVDRALHGLEADPRPAGAKRLAGQEGLLRIRIGDWRILYEVREREVLVLVVRIGQRGEVYERLG
jgi:mRNA interferase RelE/StbE